MVNATLLLLVYPEKSKFNAEHCEVKIGRWWVCFHAVRANSTQTIRSATVQIKPSPRCFLPNISREKKKPTNCRHDNLKTSIGTRTLARLYTPWLRVSEACDIRKILSTAVFFCASNLRRTDTYSLYPPFLSPSSRPLSERRHTPRLVLVRTK